MLDVWRSSAKMKVLGAEIACWTRFAAARGELADLESRMYGSKAFRAFRWIGSIFGTFPFLQDWKPGKINGSNWEESSLRVMIRLLSIRSALHASNAKVQICLQHTASFAPLVCISYISYVIREAMCEYP